MKILLDEHFQNKIAEAVRRERPKAIVQTIHERGLEGTPDSILLEILDEERVTLVTRDVNTVPSFAAARLAAGQTHGGILLVSRAIPQAAVKELSRRLVEFLDEHGGEDWRCQTGWL